MLVKLLDEGDLDRAERLAKVDMRTYLNVVGAAIDAGRAGAPTLPAFDSAAAKLDREWRTIAERGQLGALLATGALVLQVAMHERTQAVMTLFGLAVLGGIWHTAHKADMVAALDAARTEVLPALDRALAKQGKLGT
jgi:ribosome-associated translation inhibitor RaiA